MNLEIEIDLWIVVESWNWFMNHDILMMNKSESSKVISQVMICDDQVMICGITSSSSRNRELEETWVALIMLEETSVTRVLNWKQLQVQETESLQ